MFYVIGVWDCGVVCMNDVEYLLWKESISIPKLLFIQRLDVISSGYTLRLFTEVYDLNDIEAITYEDNNINLHEERCYVKTFDHHSYIMWLSSGATDLYAAWRHYEEIRTNLHKIYCPTCKQEGVKN